MKKTSKTKAQSCMIREVGLACLLLLAIVLVPVEAYAQDSSPAQTQGKQTPPDPPENDAGQGAQQDEKKPDGTDVGEETLVDMTLQRLERRAVNKNSLEPPQTNPRDMASMFYTAEQYQLLLDAIETFKLRGPLTQTTPVDKSGKPKDPGIRELSLSGIAYMSKNKWVVWLNGKRLTPKSLPKEILDIEVHENYVEMKWFDPFTELIYPIRLRPHQRFNLDMRIFLPGNL